MRKVLTFLKDFGNGVLYLGLMASFMLFVAAAMYYFKPQEFFVDAAAVAAKARLADIELAKRLLKMGGMLAAGCVAVLWIGHKIEAVIRARHIRQQKKAAAEAAKAMESK